MNNPQAGMPPRGGDHPERYECRVRLRDNPNELKHVTIEASSIDECVYRLLGQGYLVVAVKQPGHAEFESAAKLVTAGAARPAPAPKKRARKTSSIVLGKGVSTRELIFFAVQLSTLLKAGIPLIRSLEIVRRGTPNPHFQNIIEKITKSVSGGSSFGHAIRERKGVFPWVWVNLVEVGESTGKLPECLEEIAQYQEASARIQSKVVTAFFYPSILTVAVIGALTFLLIYIVPKFSAIFEQQKMELPALTQAVVAASDLVRHHAFLLLLIPVPFIILGFLIKRSPEIRFFMHMMFLRVPFFGEMSIQIAVVRFARGMSTLLKSGVQILQALDIGARLVENAYLEAGIKQVAQGVRGGQGLGAQLEARRVFPVFMTQLLSVGEETGQLEKFLDLIGTYYEERVDAFLTRLTTMLEPMMLVVMGVVIGTIVVSMFLPIIELSTRGGMGG
ncbi:MAG TPA: type II secretion system F family protein [Candidatus Omnitrophota bacterium]|jgi:type IV pilus assembly protein PilC|nr:MAG: Type II secretion system protein F [Candidatus Omnitrophica bacterium ADurb.Bin314]HOE68863.1 type II secretion system F family protein [Candidatus Omnitrophota bacterium]HPW65097.1 type II secretion system F family protein [Candidatus Omnitrophota bacterium]HQB94707.1 type II secretion system F family protein [Candidatus Omnitrophota bacterium]